MPLTRKGTTPFIPGGTIALNLVSVTLVADTLFVPNTNSVTVERFVPVIEIRSFSIPSEILNIEIIGVK